MLEIYRFVLAALCFCLLAEQASGQQGATERGRYIYVAGGCFACHTDFKKDGQELAGGTALPTPFGIFYAPNITSDREYGIGDWSDEDFLRAMQSGVSPEGQHYYPVFPYVSYSQASRADLLDLKAYIFTLPPSQQKSRPHEVNFPFSIRLLIGFWKYFNFDPKLWQPDQNKDEEWNRGSYLVNALSHCGECHTPRGVLGGLDRTRWLAGAPLEDGSWAPNLTPHETGLQHWSRSDIATALELGLTPDFDVLGGPMSAVVQYSTGKLSEADRAAIAAYLLALPPLESTERPR